MEMPPCQILTSLLQGNSKDDEIPSAKKILYPFLFLFAWLDDNRSLFVTSYFELSLAALNGTMTCYPQKGPMMSKAREVAARTWGVLQHPGKGRKEVRQG